MARPMDLAINSLALPIELVDIVALFVSNVVDGSIVLADADTDAYVGVESSWSLFEEGTESSVDFVPVVVKVDFSFDDYLLTILERRTLIMSPFYLIIFTSLIKTLR